MKLPINKLNKAGAGGANVDVSDVTFGGAFNESLVHQVVVAFQAGARSGTRAQKNRSAVSGGGAKPWAQKGTGRARAGTIRSPIFRGGGVAFPASTKDFSHKVNRKMYRAAMRAILSELHRQARLIVVDGFNLDKPSTKQFAEMLKTLKVNGGKSLVVLAEENENVELSARNLGAVSVCTDGRIDPVALISHDKVVVTVDAAKKIDEALQ